MCKNVSIFWIKHKKVNYFVKTALYCFHHISVVSLVSRLSCFQKKVFGLKKKTTTTNNLMTLIFKTENYMNFFFIS